MRFWREIVVRPARLGSGIASLDSLALSAFELAADVLPTSMKETRFFFFALRIGPTFDIRRSAGAFLGGVPTGCVAADRRAATASPDSSKGPPWRGIVVVSDWKDSSSPAAEETDSLT